LERPCSRIGKLERGSTEKHHCSFFFQANASASLLTCRRQPADRPQTVTQTRPQTSACQEGHRASKWIGLVVTPLQTNGFENRFKMASRMMIGMDAQVKLTALKAWQAAMANLQTEMARATFDTWVQSAWLVDFKDGTFIVGIGNTYGRDWLANRLTSTLERFLTGVLNTPVKVCFVVAEQEFDPVEESYPADAESSDPDDLPELDILYGSVRDSLIEPNRVVRLPTYLLRWLPYVQAQTIFVVMALWQEHYLASGGKGQRANPKVSVRAEQVCQWAGISRAQFFRLLQPGSAIYWFLKKSETDHELDVRTGKAKKSTNKYTLFDTPMTPGDAEDLCAFLQDHGIQETPAHALQEAIAADPKSILRYPVRLPPEEFETTQPQFLTVQEIVRKLLGHRLDPEILSLTDQLADRLLRRGEFILVSWYFLRNWLPLLGPDAAMLILILRNLCYFNDDTGEIRDEVWIEGGYEAIAQRLGLRTQRTVASWLPAKIERSQRKEALTDRTDQEFTRRQRLQELFSRFVKRTDYHMNATGKYAWKFKVQRCDPLTPQDEAVMEAVAKLFETAEEDGILEEVNAWIGQMSKDWDETVKEEPKVVLRRSNLARGCSETLKTALNDCFETLDLAGKGCFETLLKTLKSFKDSYQEKDSPTNQDSSTSPESGLSVEGGTDCSGNWSLEKLLTRADPKSRQTLLSQEKDALAFVSWIIYGTSQPGIQNPFSLAISRMKANPGKSAGGASERLATLLPAQLVSLIEQELSLRSPSDRDWRMLFAQTNRERICLLADVLGIGLPAEEGLWIRN
jgi:hypothetical protein